MKLIIPLAGKGTRLRPHTNTVAKPLFHLAGKPVLGHIFEQIKDIDFEEIIFIVGYLGEQIKQYVNENFDFKATFIEQKEMLGQAHAIYLAKDHLKPGDDAVIWFVDTISDANLNLLRHADCDGIIYVKEVDDPRRFGQIKSDMNNQITEIKEKADPPISNLVNIGIYYIKDSSKLISSIETLMDNNLQTKGEFYLMDAFQLMIDDGCVFKTSVIRIWEDCGKWDAVIKSNRYLIKHTGGMMPKQIPADTKIVEPVYIEEGARIVNSKIGPYVSVGKNAEIIDSEVSDSVIQEKAILKSTTLKKSIVGKNAGIKGGRQEKPMEISIGDDSTVNIE
jgi:glucose-1-phosphate thymidylyltransferase